MTAPNIFESLSKRRAERSEKKRKRCKKECPLRRGDILICTYRLDTKEPVQGIAVEVNGQRVMTDKMGVAEFLDKEPGEYRYRVDWAASGYTDDFQEGAVGVLLLPGGAILSRVSGVRPGGRLKVEVRIQHPNGAVGNLVPAQDVLRIYGYGNETVGQNTRLYERIPVDTYTVAADVKHAGYEPHSNVTATATVRRGETVIATILVKETTWLEVQVVSAETGLGIDGVLLSTIYANSDDYLATTDKTGLARRTMLKNDETFDLEWASSQGSSMYLADSFA
jgi:hypothetical protein